MAVENMGGIYEIVNLVNGKRYVGSAVSFKRRWMYHRRDLRSGQHHSKYLLASWRKYGEGAFEFRVVESVDSAAMLLEREQVYIDSMRPEYNSRPVACSNIGHRWTLEQRTRISGRRKGLRVLPIGYRHSEETRRKLAEIMTANPSFLGKEHTAETRLKMSVKRRALLAEDGARERLRSSLARPEVRAKKSANMLGNKLWLGRSHSEETKDKLRAKLSGRFVSDETRQRMADAQRRKAPPSVETRAKMGASRSGLRNGAAIKTAYTIEHESGDRLTDIPMNLRSMTGISASSMSELIRGNRVASKGWRLAAPS